MATTAKGIPGITGGNNWNLETDWQNTINAVDNLLDARGTAAQRTAALAGVPVGTHWQDTDGIRMLWRKDGAAWVPAVWDWGGTTAQMNGFTQAPDGFRWFNTTDRGSYARVSGTWRPLNENTILAGSGSLNAPTSGVLVPWQSALNNTAGMWAAGNPTRLTAQVAGIYLFQADVYGATLGVPFKTAFRVDGASVDSGAVSGNPPSAVWPTQNSLTRLMKLNAGQYVELRLIGPAAFDINLGLSSFSVMRVA